MLTKASDLCVNVVMALKKRISLFRGILGALTEPIILDAVDRSVIETVDDFVRFRQGFHGDTGMREHLYCHLMQNLPDRGRYRRTDGGGTLLVQPEWYTKLLYRKTGEDASSGRFDLGIPNPKDLDLDLAKPRLLVAFECGRNKKVADLLPPSPRDGIPYPTDITKLVNEIELAKLPYGYALEFYDEDQGQADELIRRIERLSSVESNKLRVVVLECLGGRTPMLRFLPKAWDERIRRQFGEKVDLIELLTCAAIEAPPPPKAAAWTRQQKGFPGFGRLLGRRARPGQGV
jgi:hypothetical protein